jgi:hypothetical protein
MFLRCLRIVFLTVLLCLTTLRATISPAEAAFICQYNGVTGFPVPCSDASNACNYGGISCNATNGASWNQTITRLNLVLEFDPNRSNVMPTEIGNLRSLQYLSWSTLSAIQQSTLPTEIGLCNLTYLMIADNAFTGTIPTELFANQNLQSLDLTLTQFTGTLPNQLSSLVALQFLSVGATPLTGTFPSIDGLTLLHSFDISDGNFTGLPPNVVNAHSLQTYRIVNNQFYGSPPSFNSSALVSVDLSHNFLNGTLSSTTLIGWPGGAPLYFSLKANQLQGTLPVEIFAPSMVALDLSYNSLSGVLPSQAMVNAPFLEQVVLSHNALSGSLPSAWQDFVFPALFKFSLDHNLFSGTMPRFAMRAQRQATPILPGGLSPHIYLDMSDNALSGPVPAFEDFASPASVDFSNNLLTLTTPSFGTAVNLSWLNMANNQVGTLPSDLFGDLGRFNSLVTLDLSHCAMTGTLPGYFHVQYLNLNSNLFTGQVTSAVVLILSESQLPAFIDVRLNRLAGDASKNTYFGNIMSYQDEELILNDFPQDVDECGLQISQCEYQCVDGWFPVPGYTCGCPSGFKLDEVNKLNCTVVCGDGLLRYPQETCDYAYSPLGCFANCTAQPGYTCDALGCRATCGDGLVVPPEECDTQMVGCNSNNCTAETDYACSPISNTCQLCAQEWQPFVYPLNLQLFPSLRTLLTQNLSALDFFMDCVSCSGGFALETRNVLATTQCFDVVSQRSEACSFACSNLTVFSSARESLFTLKQELERGDFLSRLFWSLFQRNISISLQQQGSRRRTTTDPTTVQLDFNITPCGGAGSENISDWLATLRALSLDIVPNIPLLTLANNNAGNPCILSLRTSDPTSPAPVPPVVIAGIVIFIFLVLAAGVLYAYYKQSELHSLPHEVSWSFMDQLTHPWRWEYHGSSKSGYYARVYAKNSAEYQKVISLLTTHFKKGALAISSVVAVYNRALSVSFVNQWKVMTTRRVQSPEQFFHVSYTKDMAKLEVMKYYHDNLLQFTSYNQALQVPLLPVLHGTDYLVAEKIAQTGFASLSSLDAGFFGKGIYFTTHLLYTLPYCCMKRNPAVIISYVNMGNIYPVTEDHRGERNLVGQALKSGYTSHLVLTNKKGNLYDKKEDIETCDEIVVAQESQILPAFIVRLDIGSCLHEFEKWDRVVPQPLKNGLQYADLTETAHSDSIIYMDNSASKGNYVIYDI